MEKDLNNFELEFKAGKLKIQKHSIGAQVIFRIQFSDGRTPLVITRATHADAFRFWTSVPEGRQKEAEEIGALIAAYFKSSQ